MKNFTKIMTVVGVIAIASLLLAFVTTSPENEGNEKILSVRVFESQGFSFMVIVDENGKQETVELAKLVAKKDPQISNIVLINKALNDIGTKGYKLVAQSGGNDVYCITTTYTFVKK